MGRRYGRRRGGGATSWRGSSGGSSSGACRTSSSATTRRRQIWARALPLLVVAYLLLGLNALDLERLEPRREPRRRRLRHRRRGLTWVVANRLRGRRWFERPRDIGAAELAVFIVVPAIPSLVVGQWGDALQTVLTASPSSPSLWALTSYGVSAAAALGVAAHRGPARAAVQRRRPGPAAAAAVHHVPVHQRRGVAGRRHADRRRVRRRAGRLLPARRRVRAVAHPDADALSSTTSPRGREVGDARRRHAGGRRARRAPPAARRRRRTPTARGAPAGQHRPRDDLLAGDPDHRSSASA